MAIIQISQGHAVGPGLACGRVNILSLCVTMGCSSGSEQGAREAYSPAGI